MPDGNCEDKQDFPWLYSHFRRILLDMVPKCVDIGIMCLSSKELFMCNLLLYGHGVANILNNCVIIEAMLKYIKSPGHFKKKYRVSIQNYLSFSIIAACILNQSELGKWRKVGGGGVRTLVSIVCTPI